MPMNVDMDGDQSGTAANAVIKAQPSERHMLRYAQPQSASPALYHGAAPAAQMYVSMAPAAWPAYQQPAASTSSMPPCTVHSAHGMPVMAQPMPGNPTGYFWGHPPAWAHQAFGLPVAWSATQPATSQSSLSDARPRQEQLESGDDHDEEELKVVEEQEQEQESTTRMTASSQPLELDPDSDTVTACESKDTAQTEADAQPMLMFFARSTLYLPYINVGETHVERAVLLVLHHAAADEQVEMLRHETALFQKPATRQRFIQEQKLKFHDAFHHMFFNGRRIHPGKAQFSLVIKALGSDGQESIDAGAVLYQREFYLRSDKTRRRRVMQPAKYRTVDRPADMKLQKRSRKSKPRQAARRPCMEQSAITTPVQTDTYQRQTAEVCAVDSDTASTCSSESSAASGRAGKSESPSVDTSPEKRAAAAAIMRLEAIQRAGARYRSAQQDYVAMNDGDS